MSEFDKEAERERLREKFEAEREDREATQRMSELLLQGATMTNKHCEECGDPIFRYEGEEFCPTCQTTHAEAANGETAPEGAGDAAAETAPESGTETETEAEDSEPVVEASGDTEAPPTGGTDQESPTASPEASAPEPAVDVTPSETSSEPREAAPRTQPAPSPDVADVDQPAESTGDLVASRAAVSRTLADLARRAEATDDLGRKRTLLAAVREAAEAITAIDEATR